MENNKLIIKFGENEIVAEIYDMNGPEIPPELTVYLRNKNGVILQDICLVRPHYEINRKTMEFKTDNDFVDCLVWGESGYEDYTEKHVIAVYDEEDY
jgi:hypothetical protein